MWLSLYFGAVTPLSRGDVIAPWSLDVVASIDNVIWMERWRMEGCNPLILTRSVEAGSEPSRRIPTAHSYLHTAAHRLLSPEARTLVPLRIIEMLQR